MAVLARAGAVVQLSIRLDGLATVTRSHALRGTARLDALRRVLREMTRSVKAWDPTQSVRSHAERAIELGVLLAGATGRIESRPLGGREPVEPPLVRLG